MSMLVSSDPASPKNEPSLLNRIKEAQLWHLANHAQPACPEQRSAACESAHRSNSHLDQTLDWYLLPRTGKKCYVDNAADKKSDFSTPATNINDITILYIKGINNTQEAIICLLVATDHLNRNGRGL